MTRRDATVEGRTLAVGEYSYTLPKRPKQHCRFLSKEESYDVHGYSINGLVFIGSTLDQSFNEDPAVVDPTLPIQKLVANEPLGYWPNYATLNGAQRHQYLSWLSKERADTDEIGYVFLYLYGFERYVLRDANHDIDALRHKNLIDIAADLQRLKRIFRKNRSFSDYANQLLDVISVLYWPDRIDERKAVFPNKRPIAATFAIARIASVTPDEPLDSDWALQWLVGYGPVSRTKTVREQYPILRSLFKAVYEIATDGGLKVPACKTTLDLTIAPASRNLDVYCRLEVPSDWCDPTGLQLPMSTLVAISDVVVPALRKMAKAVTENDVAGILSAWPAGIPTDSVPKLKQIVDRATAYLQKGNHCDVATLGKQVGVIFNNKSTKPKLKQMAAALESCGYVMVPDAALTPCPLKLTDKVTTYRGTRVKALSAEGTQIALSVQLACLFDTVVDNGLSAQKAPLDKLIGEHPHTAEKTYLSNYLNWQLVHRRGAAGLERQIRLLSNEQQKKLAGMLVALCVPDGDIPDTTLKQLETLFARVGLIKGLLSEQLASSVATASVSEPVVTLGEPTSNDTGDAFMQLDESALRSHTASTKEIQCILHQFFQEDPSDEDDCTELRPDADNTTWHNGLLDDSHHQLATWLLTQDEWSMDDIRSKSQSLGISADGALEAINNAAFDTLGDSLLEIGDPVTVYRDVLFT